MQHISQTEMSAGNQDRPSRHCQHDQVPDDCAACALIEVRDTLRELRPVLQAALRNPLVRRWLGL